MVVHTLSQIEISQSDYFLLSTHLNKIRVPAILSFDYHSLQRGTESQLEKHSPT